MKSKNLLVITVTLMLYMINQNIKGQIEIPYLGYFMRCYFNDIIGSITFCAYCNFIFNLSNRKMNKLWQIELLMLFCGFVWEVVTPLFRYDTVFDVLDFPMYLIGGILYYLIAKLIYKEAIRN